MICFTFKYQYTQYVRVPSGVMETEFSHTEIRGRELSVIVPENTPKWKEIATAYCTYYAGNNQDKAFQILEVVTTPIHAILHADTRL